METLQKMKRAFQDTIGEILEEKESIKELMREIMRESRTYRIMQFGRTEL